MRNRTIHEALRLLPYGLYAVGVRGEDGESNALAVSWITQCSFNPPLMMLAVRRDTASYQLLKRGKYFTVNILDKNEQKIVRALVKPSHRVGNKLGKISHFEEDTGAPILRKAFAFLECRVRELHEPGDHALVIGEVVHAALLGSGEPLTCADIRWHYAG